MLAARSFLILSSSPLLLLLLLVLDTTTCCTAKNETEVYSTERRYPSISLRRKKKHDVPSVEIDCAIRHFAMEVAIDRLPWSSPTNRGLGQQRHISDALRLQECPLDSPLEDAQNNEDKFVNSNESGAPSFRSAQILRGRRRMKRSESKEFPTSPQDTSPQDTFKDDDSNTSDTDAIILYVDPHNGDDKAQGTIANPLETIPAAIQSLRNLRFSQSNARNTNATIFLRGGRYYLQEPLRLDSRDSHLTIQAYKGESAILSGGDLLSLTLTPTPENPSVYSAKIPQQPNQNKFNFTMLFLDRSNAEDAEENMVGRRLIWAREPNGHPERDLQPDGYAAANGTDSHHWPSSKGAVHFVIGKNDGAARNSTIYPWHGEDLDPRGGGCHNWLHFGGSGNAFGDGKGYWNGTVPMGLKFHGATLNTSNWTPEGYAPAVAHVFHNAFWGNWQFEIDSVTTNDNAQAKPGVPQDGKITFKKGGFQEGRGGGIKNQPFYIEGVKEALDEPGEWWLDVPNQVLYYYPHKNETTSTTNMANDGKLQMDFIAPRLHRLLEVEGENSKDRTAKAIVLQDLTFAHSATTFMEPYEVPSPGDWSIHRGGALFLENACDISIQGCLFLRTGGNALTISGHSKQIHISRNEFAWIGDSAIVTLGKIPMADGFTVDTYPENTLIESNLFREIGIHGKQTSALFSALSCKTTFIKNVLFNGPRAGININDSFCHGHTIRDNLLFNWVRETQDHGPINTWDRAMYIQKGESGIDEHGMPFQNPTMIPQWTHIERNFIMNGPSGNRDKGNLFPTIDNDDGSSYYYISENFLVYGGGKNYLGHDKLWMSNFFVFPGRWSGDPCAQIWAGKNHYFAENTCLIAPGDNIIGLDGSTKFGPCILDWDDPKNLEFVALTHNNSYYLDEEHAWHFGCGNGTSPSHSFTLSELQKHGWEIGSTVHDSKLLTADAIINRGMKLLGMHTDAM